MEVSDAHYQPLLRHSDIHVLARSRTASFHAKYQGDEVTVNIETGEITGNMSRRALALIEEWRLQHETELADNWNRAVEKQALNAIAPLE